MRRAILSLIFVLSALISVAEDLHIQPQYWCKNAKLDTRAYNDWQPTYGEIEITLNADKGYLIIRIGSNVLGSFEVLSADQVLKYEHQTVWMLKTLDNERGERVVFQVRVSKEDIIIVMVSYSGNIGFWEKV